MGTTKGTPEHTPSEKNSEGDNETLQGRQAEELFPDFFEQSAKGKYDGPAVPQPPGDSWLESDNAESREDAGLQALVLMESIHHAQVEQTLQEMGYATVAVQSAEQALEQFRTAQYHLVLCGINTVYSSFHNYITQSVVQQRRRNGSQGRTRCKCQRRTGLIERAIEHGCAGTGFKGDQLPGRVIPQALLAMHIYLHAASGEPTPIECHRANRAL